MAPHRRLPPDRRRRSAAAGPLPPQAAFTARVLAVVRRIPRGRVATYGDVARLAGRPGAARAVGNAMRNCHQPDVPCHRVIASGGRLGGYGGSELLKRGLLMAEGIPFSGLRIPHVHDVLFHGQRPEELARRGTGRAGSSRTKGRW